MTISTGAGRSRGIELPADRTELNKARILLDRFNESQTPRGGTGATFRAVRAIAQAGSSSRSPIHAPSDLEFARKLADSSQFMDEPWVWLASMAEGAERFGEHHLLASVAFFTFNWHGFLTPRIEARDEYEMRLLRGVPLAQRVKIYRVATRGLVNANPSHVLIRDPNGGTGRPFTIIQVVVSIAINIRKNLAEYPSDLQSFAQGFGL